MNTLLRLRDFGERAELIARELHGGHERRDAARVARIVGEMVTAKRFEDAIALARACVNMAPRLGEAWNVLSYAYSFAHGLEAEQIAAAREAVMLKPDDPTAWHNLSVGLMRVFHFDEALEAGRRAGALPLDDKLAYVPIQTAFLASLLGAHVAALEYLAQARALLAPDDPVRECREAELDLGCALAYAGMADWQGFLDNLETRHALFGTRLPNFMWDMWKRGRFWQQNEEWKHSGEREALVYLEWGIGDQIQFARLIPWLLRGLAFAGGGVISGFSRIMVACSRPLLEIVASIDGVDETIDHTLLRADNIRPDVAVIPVIDLMRLLHVHGAFPLGAFRAPYIRPPSPQLEWWPNSQPGRVAIAFSWQGDPKQTQDFARRIPFRAWADFARDNAESYTFHSMQTKFAGHIEAWEGWPAEVPLDDTSAINRDMRDAAELIEKCDVFVGQCGALVHLAGAMGKPCVVLLGWSHDYRWDFEPLYDCVLVRQTRPGDWASAFAQLPAAIEEALTRRTAEFSQQER